MGANEVSPGLSKKKSMLCVKGKKKKVFGLT